jgi:uncharacterized protein
MRGKPASILWKRLDTEGHDGCRLVALDAGWRLDGVAAFLENGLPCGLAYVVECDAGWRSGRARVTGVAGSESVDIAIEHTSDGRWLVSGVEQADVTGLVDVDLGFTPATNLIALQRLALAVGVETPAPAAYLTFPQLRLERLDQSYRRLDEHRYHYRSPAYGYDDVITVGPSGFVTDYPGLWLAVA